MYYLRGGVLLRKLIVAIIFLACIIPIAIMGLRGPSVTSSIEGLERDMKGQAITDVLPPKIEQHVETNVPSNVPSVVVKTVKQKEKKVIVIDPGHQRYADYRLEKVGPKSEKWMPKMPASTYGVTTGQAEHELTLKVATYLQSYLEKQGYKVKLTRQEHIIAMSTKERAGFANTSKADLYIQLHADGVTNAQGKGLYTIAPKKNNPYTKKIYKDSQSLAQAIVNSAVDNKIDVYKKGKIHSESLTALNWAKMPTVLVELGYLNNSKDDVRLAKDDYQKRMAKAIAIGIKEYDSK